MLHWLLGFLTGLSLGSTIVLVKWRKEYEYERRWAEHLAVETGNAMMIVEARFRALDKIKPPRVN